MGDEVTHNLSEESNDILSKSIKMVGFSRQPCSPNKSSYFHFWLLAVQLIMKGFKHSCIPFTFSFAFYSKVCTSETTHSEQSLTSTAMYKKKFQYKSKNQTNQNCSKTIINNEKSLLPIYTHKKIRHVPFTHLTRKSLIENKNEKAVNQLGGL